VFAYGITARILESCTISNFLPPPPSQQKLFFLPSLHKKQVFLSSGFSQGHSTSFSSPSLPLTIFSSLLSSPIQALPPFSLLPFKLVYPPSLSTTGWGGESWTKTVFFHSIGLHVILKLILGLKSTDWCGLDPWLTTIQF
jgi:hypothetical protein